MPLFLTLVAILSGCLTTLFATPSYAQNTTARSTGFAVPEWKSADGQIVVKLRGRAVHDFYQLTRDFGGTTRDGETTNDDLRALRFGVDGQLSPKVRFRADANLTSHQINWVDVYIGYVDPKFEVFIGQNYMASPMETVEGDTNYLLPEASLVKLAFGLNQRNFGVVGRAKGSNWQVVGGLFHGNLNAGDVLGDDVLRYVQARATYAPVNSDGDVVHLGVNVRLRDAQDGPNLRYATRSAATNFGPRLLDSRAIGTGDTTLSFEAMVIKGSLMISAEHDLLWADTRAGQVAMWGTDLEARWWITGETRRYVVGIGSVAPVRPKRSVRAGGPGAVAIVARYDHLDQSDSNIGPTAGRMYGVSLGMAWIPVEFIMFRLAVAQSRYNGPSAFVRGTAQTVTGRAQFSF